MHWYIQISLQSSIKAHANSLDLKPIGQTAAVGCYLHLDIKSM